MAQKYAFDAFGNLMSSSGTLTNNYRFQTKELHSKSSLVYFGGRWYNPAVGRWITPDPLGIIDGPNLYCYLNNNPINDLDPWGLCGGQPPWGQAWGVQDKKIIILGEGIIPVSLWEDPIFAVGFGAGKLVTSGLTAGAKTVLYSGAGQDLRAAASSGIPIFKTFIGGSMYKFEMITGVRFPRIMWDVASAIYATGAKGTVQVFLNESNYNSTFYRIEAKVIEFLGKAEMIFK
ncbi:MAG: hypothetical protein PHE58_05050 [Candidatus Omnitrophica bacterium]|nr:hypothetical protein [Candidatus Omnitrophota bacterium]